MYRTNGHWTQLQRDIIELGERAARCLKGENAAHLDGSERALIVAGRAHRGMARASLERNRSHVFGRRPNWFYEALLQQLEEAKAYEQRRVKVRDKKIAALERQQAQLRSILQIHY